MKMTNDVNLEEFVEFKIDVNKSVFEAEKEYRKLYGKNGIREAVYAVLFSSPIKNDVLITKRSKKEEWGPNTYAPIGGTINWNDFETIKEISKLGMEMGLLEVFVQTITREIREEIIKDVPCMTQFEYIGSYIDKKTGYKIHVLSGFLVRSGEGLEEQLSGKIGIESRIKEELSEVEFIPLEEIVSLEKEGKIKMMPGSKNVIKVYLKNKKLI